MKLQPSDEEIYQNVSEIAQQFKIFQCVECAEAIKTWLKARNINGVHLRLKVVGRGNFILSERWDGSQNAISQNGKHYGIEVRGKVFDNLSPFGLLRENWLKDFSCHSGNFFIEEIERF